MGSLSFGAKMGIIGAIGLLPISLLAVLLHLQIHGDAAFYKLERLGVTYTRALRPLFADFEERRLGKHDSVAAAALGRRVNADFAAAFAADRSTGRPLELTPSLLALRTKWFAHADPPVLLGDFVALLADVSDNSKITLDPMLDGYYVGDAMVNKIPSLIDGLARLGALDAHAPLGPSLGPHDRIAYSLLAGQISAARDGIEHDISIALKAAPYLAPTLAAALGREHAASSRTIAPLSPRQLESDVPNGAPADWARLRGAALAAGFGLYDDSISALDDVLRRRIEALVRREIAIFLIVGVAIALAAGLMVVTARSMSRQLADKIALEHEIVERTQVEGQLAHAAYHDTLTGLSNRALLMDRLNGIVAKADIRPHPWAILFLDLDRFKVVNDSLGHVIGDIVLVQAARRFEECVRSSDTLVRLGGDEFIILIEDLEEVEVAYEIARRVLRAFDAPFDVAGREVFASASIGIAMSPSGDERPENVLRNADIAMYRAKALGKNRYEVFTPDLLTSAITRLEVETDLAHALERKEFRLFYQPIIALEAGQLKGFEALVRWQHPARGLVNPDQFISVAEENGIIVAIGEWILREGCRQLQTWRTTIANAQDLRMNINVSAKQLTAPNFVRTMESALSACGLNPDAVNMEITESVLMENADHARLILAQIKRLGVHIHLDDFGTGYSSLAYLRDFPIDALKIDKSFVSRSDGGTPRSALASVEIVRTIIALAQSLALTVTAEGVETDGQRDQLRALGCTRGQGYFFSRPVDALGAAAFIAARVNPPSQLALQS